MTAGRVTAVWGSAFYRQEDGSLKPVRVGDELTSGQQVLTNQDGIVEIAPKALSPKLTQLIQAAADVARTVKQLEVRDPEVVPAAGLGPFGGGSLLPGVRVERIAEAVTPQSFERVALLVEDEGAVQPVPFVPLGLSVPSSASDEFPMIRVPEDERPIPLTVLAVSEEGLQAGLPDAMGAGDTTDLNVASEAVNVEASAPRTGLVLSAPVQSVYAANGQKLVWSSDGQSGLIAKTVAEPTATNVLTAQWDEVAGQVKVTLLQPLLHPDAGEDQLSLSFELKAPGGGAPVAVVHVQVEDDAPIEPATQLVHGEAQPVTGDQWLASPIEGSLLDGAAMGGDGLGLVHSLTTGGQSHLTDPSLPIMTVTTGLGGTLTVDVRTGQYTYLPPPDRPNYGVDQVDYTVVDQDGDVAMSTWQAVVNPYETVLSTSKADTLVGHDGTDVFKWGFSSPNVTIPAAFSVDHVVGFKLGKPDLTGADILDLRDLLRGEHLASGGEGLSHFIQIETDAAGTQLHISTRGRYDSPASQPQWHDPTIVLDGVDLRGDLGLSASASSAEVINKLIAQGQLYLDP